MKKYLDVPFAEKDIVKSLGARWDSIAKQWYVSDGTDPQPFEKWSNDTKSQSSQTSFAPMKMTEKDITNFGISVVYSRDDGFFAYQGCPPAHRKKDSWEAFLGVPTNRREFEVFQGRLARYPRNTRNSEKILDFLSKSLFETWDDSLATSEDRKQPEYHAKWEDYVVVLIQDLSDWILERSFTKEWDPTHNRWVAGNRRSDW